MQAGGASMSVEEYGLVWEGAVMRAEEHRQVCVCVCVCVCVLGGCSECEGSMDEHGDMVGVVWREWERCVGEMAENMRGV